MRLFVACLMLALLMGCTTQNQGANQSPGPADLRVMSFNIRYPNPGDGENYWPNRQGFVIDTINDFGPDILGVQEAYTGPAQAIHDGLDGYTRIGVGREDGKDKGEMTAVYFSESRFTLIDHGHFWLSDTPEVVGSVGWDADLTRMATWLVLDDATTGKRLVVLNAHLDHRGSRSRIESCKLIRRTLARLLNAQPGASGIVMGDFNADAMGSEPYDAMMEGESPTLIDTFAVAQPNRATHDGTFHAFTGERERFRIDWIVTTNDLSVKSSDIVTVSREGRYPSDHFPVTAVLRAED